MGVCGVCVVLCMCVLSMPFSGAFVLLCIVVVGVWWGGVSDSRFLLFVGGYLLWMPDMYASRVGFYEYVVCCMFDQIWRGAYGGCWALCG